MDDLRITCQMIEIAEFVGVKSTGHQIANLAGGFWSRATTYRKLKKAESIGLAHEKKNRGGHEWTLTQKGKKFLEQWNMLPNMPDGRTGNT